LNGSLGMSGGSMQMSMKFKLATVNKSKHADLAKLSPFLFQKSRQLHQAGI
jgi:hypothetical protein